MQRSIALYSGTDHDRSFVDMVPPTISSQFIRSKITAGGPTGTTLLFGAVLGTIGRNCSSAVITSCRSLSSITIFN